ncbi:MULTISPECIES: DNA-formamidopyrimidine glycosylase [unclassified Prochlorococcus]|uniref:DNA-formamidopyrimidine glycosylase n=1 Tax=unclassified Prochlorococcus TaxID=2627481 RepID=UPI0005339F90|nr:MULTISPECIES: DNA-formamidopyrimidine glycosylase [unclassified Prochlorococcus]KGG16589.1 Formamidopyrimidine-DNA glycosylase [Prochlorococcus sp. MIT 0602]KGG16936.1 Formamidopyrimidine-DNA glycosylase [Prochlorococcus sp. MIT 0603]
MPELPEVETVKRGLENHLEKFLIKDIEVLSERSISSDGGSKVLINAMVGLVIGDWRRRGKYLISSLHNQDIQNNFCGWWVIHLRMTGQFQWFTSKHKTCPHTRVRLLGQNESELRFVDTRNFGQMWWIPNGISPEEKIRGLKRLGPEPFSKDFNPTYLQNELKNRTRSIKASLLDQATLAGIGNIYADESLFEAGIIPTKESNQLTKYEIEKLYASLFRVLKISIGKGGTTFKDFRDLKGVNGNYGGQAWVYGRGNKSCRKCGTTIIKKKILGRGTHWCPNCQK